MSLSEGPKPGSIELFVGNVPISWTKEDLSELFSVYANVGPSVVIQATDPSSRSTIGYIAVASQSEADACIDNLHRFPVDGMMLRVEVQRNRTENTAQSEQSAFHSSSAFSSYSQAKAGGLGALRYATPPVTPASSALLSGGARSRAATLSAQSPMTPLSNDSRAGASVEVSPTCHRGSCTNPGKHRCSRCKVPYCSPECQTEDWTLHRLLCIGMAPASASPLATLTTARERTASPVVSSVGLSASPALAVSHSALPSHSGFPATDECTDSPVPGVAALLNVFDQVLGGGDHQRLTDATSAVPAADAVQFTSNSSIGQLTPHSQSDSRVQPVVSVIGLAASSATQLCVRLADKASNDLYHTLTGLLSKCGMSAEHSLPYNQLTLDNICLVKISPALFCRARLLCPPVGEGRISVQLIDEGQVTMVDCENVYALPPDLHASQVPALAFQLALHDVYSAGQNKEAGGVSVLNDLIKDRLLTATVIGHTADQSIAYAVLRDGNGLLINDAVANTPYADAFRNVPSSPALLTGPVAAAPIKSPNIPGFSAARLQGPCVDTPAVMPLPRGFQCISLSAGSTQVQLSCIRDECPDIYVQVANQDQRSRLARLNSSINSVIHVSDSTSYLPDIGELCAACYGNDGMFYRARVELQESSYSFQVMFVDYGNRATVSLTDLRALRHEFGVLPFQAVRCSLSAIKPASGAVSWSHQTRQLLQQADALSAYLVAAAATADMPHTVELFNRSVSVNILLNKELVKHGMAVYKAGETPPVDVRASSTKVVGQAASAPSPLASKTGRKLAERYVLLEAGKSYKVVVVFMQDVGHFYISVLDETASQQLDGVSSLIQQHCATPADSSFKPRVGDLCCALFAEDGLYYRAEVLETAQSTLTVRFVDFGSTAQVQCTDVRSMKAEFMELLPCQAIPVSLFNLIACNGSRWSSEANSYFAELTDAKVLTCQCASKQQSTTSNGGSASGASVATPIYLFDDSDPKRRIDMRSALAKRDYAQYVTVPSDGQRIKPIKVPTIDLRSPNEDPAGTEPARLGDTVDSSRDDMPRHAAVSSGTPHRGTAVVASAAPSYQLAHLKSPGFPSQLSFPVCVSEARRPSSVWLQPDPGAVAKILKLSEALRSRCTSASMPASFSPGVGDVCCALFDADAQYYRAVVADILPDGRYHVRYIDFGNTATISRSSLYPATAVSLDLPVQAVECQLPVSLPPNLPSWPEEVESVLGECVDRHFEAIRPADPNYFSGLPAVDLEDVQTGSSVSDRIATILHKSTPLPVSSEHGTSGRVDNQHHAVPVTTTQSPSDTEVKTSSHRRTVTTTQSPSDTEVKTSSHRRTVTTTQSPSDTEVKTSSHRRTVTTTQSPSDTEVKTSSHRRTVTATQSPSDTEVKTSSHRRIFAKGLPRYKLPVGEAVICVSTEVTSPTSFWLTKASCLEELNDLLDLMENPAEYPTPHLPCIGELCAVQYSEDSNWYRARINCVVDDVVEVTFMDFGNSETTTTTALRPLQPEHLKLPLQGVECTLDGCQPIFGSKWSSEAIATFQGFMCETELACTSQDLDDGLGPCKVALELDGMAVVSRLVASGHAICLDQNASTAASTTTKPAIKVVVTSTPASLDHPARPGNSASLPRGASPVPRGASPVPRGASPVPRNAAPPVLSSIPQSKGGVSPRGSSRSSGDDLPRERPAPCGESGPPSPSTHSLQELYTAVDSNVKWSSLPESNDDFYAILSELVHPGCFYVQLADSSAIEQLNVLMESMNAAFSDVPPPQALVTCAEGTVCAAQFSEDGGWYRATVLRLLGGDQCEVRFSDFGNKDTVSNSLLRSLTSEMLELPMQAIECSLASIEPPSADWPEGATSVFKDHVGPIGATRVTLHRVTPRSSDAPRNAVQVFSASDPRTINDILVASHLAVEARHVSIPAPAAPAPASAPAAAPAAAAAAHSTAPASPLNFTLSDLTAVQPDASDGFFEGLICDVQSPGLFHLQVAKSEVAQQIQALGDEIMAFSSISNPVKLTDLSANDLCLAQFSVDRCWYRVVVCEINGDSALIRYVDFGNMDTVSESALRHFDKRFLSVPRQAIQCRLRGVESSQPDGSWTKAAGKKLECYSRSALCVQPSSEQSGALVVDLFDTSGGDDINVADEIIKAGFGKRQELKAASEDVTQQQQQHQQQQQQLQHQQQHQQQHQHQQQQQQQPQQLARAHRSTFPTSALPRDGLFEVLVVDTRTPSSFSVQSGEKESILASANLVAEMAEVLDASDPVLGYCPILGEICCARFSEDGGWYRAEVNSVAADHLSVDVTFVDFGNCEDNVSAAETRPLPAEFAKQPKQAVECALHGVVPAPRGATDWSAEAVECMKSLTPMTMKLLAERKGCQDDTTLLDLLDSSGAVDTWISQKLVDAGHARRVL